MNDLVPIPRTSAAAACADRLRDGILSGAFAVGARLPPERKLAEDFAVNRVTVRAALTTLVSEGLLAIRQGSGAQVTDFRITGGLALLPAWIRLASVGDGAAATAAIADLLAVRRSLARVVVGKLGALDDDALDRIDDAVAAFAAVIDRNVDVNDANDVSDGGVAAADLGVVRALLHETGSPVLAMCLNPVATLLAALPQLRSAMYAVPRDNLTGWQSLLELLRAARGTPASLFESAVDVVIGDLAARDEATLARLRSQQHRSRT